MRHAVVMETEVHASNWSFVVTPFKYSHYQPFQKGDERHDWPHALYHKTHKCNSNVSGHDCRNLVRVWLLW